jgi:hypothetical protein
MTMKKSAKVCQTGERKRFIMALSADGNTREAITPRSGATAANT